MTAHSKYFSSPARARAGSARARAGAALTVLTFSAFAGINGAGTANADPCDPWDPKYGTITCIEWKTMTVPPRPTPTTTVPRTPSTSNSDSSTASTWVSDHAMGIAVVAVIIGCIWWAIAASNAKEAAEAATLARGRAIANQHYESLVAAAQAAVPTPDPSDFDPLGLGVAPPTPEPVELPPRPPMAESDLKRYSTFSAVVPWTPGTAFAALVGRDGGTARAAAAWLEACQLAGLGDVNEDGTFTTAAVFVNVAAPLDGTGDVEVTVDPVSYLTGTDQLNRVIPFFVRTARVGTATKFERIPSSDHHVTRLSMNSTEPAPAAAQPADQVTVDPKWA